MRNLFFLFAFLTLLGSAQATESDLYWLGGTGSNGQPIWIPVSNANPMPVSGGGGGVGCTPSGGNATTNIITYGVAGACAADTLANLTNGALTLGASGTAGSVVMGNATSGLLTLQPAAGALGAVTVSIPAASDTLVNLASAQALTNKTYNGLTLTSSTGTLTVANGKTLTVSNTLTLAGTDGSTLNVGAGGTLGALAFITPGTGIATALGVNVGSAGAPVLFNGALGTPSSGVGTNLTGTAAGLTAGTATVANGLKSATTTVVVSAATAPTVGQVLTAINGTTADWETPGGGGTLTVTDGTHAITSTTSLTVPIGQLLVGGSAGAATLTPIVTDTTTAGSISSWNIGGQNFMSSSGTATFPTLTAGQSMLLVTGSGATATLSASGITLNGLASTSTLRQFAFISCVFNASTVYDCAAFPGFGTITSGALMKFAGADGAATAGDLSGDCTTSAALVITCTKTGGTAFGTLATTTPGTGVATAAAANLSAAGGLSTTIGSGTATLATSAISSAACATAVTVSIPNTATTDVIWWGFNGDPTAVTGYSPATAGMLTIIAYPTSGNANFKVCNNTSSSVTPGAITLNVRVIR